MTAFEDEITQTALDAIEEYGKTVTLQRQGTKTYNSATLKYEVAEPPEPEDFKAIAKDFDAASARALGALVKSGDKLFTMAAKGKTKPTLGDKLTIDGETLMIVPKVDGGLEVLTVYAGEVPALYKVHGRKS